MAVEERMKGEVVVAVNEYRRRGKILMTAD